MIAQPISTRYNQLPSIHTALEWAEQQGDSLNNILAEIGRIYTTYDVSDWTVVLLHHHDKLQPGQAIEISHESCEKDTSKVIQEAAVGYPCYLHLDEHEQWAAYEHSVYPTRNLQDGVLREVASYLIEQGLGKMIGIAYTPFPVHEGKIWLETLSEAGDGTVTRLCQFDRDDPFTTVTEWALDGGRKMKPLKAYRSTDAGHVVVKDPPTSTRA